MRKRSKLLVIAFLLISTYYLGGYLYYEYILPYSVKEGNFSLNSSNQELEIEYNDPDISYRDLLVEIRLVEGADIEIIYIRCSDEAKLNLEEGRTASFYHNFAGTILIRLLDPSTSANGSYEIIDRASFLVPKSATKACTGMPRLAFMFNITVILLVIVILGVATYFVMFRSDIWKK